MSVPLGTCVYELIPIETQEAEQREKRKHYSSLDNYKREILADLNNKGDEVKVVNGGKGGKGITGCKQEICTTT